jgi:hypothetical protein
LINDGEEKELHVKLKQKALIELDFILGENDEREKIKQIDDYFYDLMKPKQFWGTNGFEIQHDISFETNCTVLSQHLSVRPKDMTTLEYINSMQELKKQFDRSNK